MVLAAEVGDFRRFANPRQLMAWLGLVPSEHSSGAKVERGGITKAGNGRARRVLVEGAWSYRFPARVTSPIQARLEGVPEAVRAIAWKAQLRLCARYRRLVAAGKNANLVTDRDRPRDGGLRLGDRVPGPARRCRRLSRSSPEDHQQGGRATHHHRTGRAWPGAAHGGEPSCSTMWPVTDARP